MRWSVALSESASDAVRGRLRAARTGRGAERGRHRQLGLVEIARQHATDDEARREAAEREVRVALVVAHAATARAREYRQRCEPADDADDAARVDECGV